MAEIKLAGIEKAYTKGTPPAVTDLNLNIADGEFLCLLGPSGCGKTTTLRMIAGLEHPTAGSITVGNRVVDSVEDGIFLPPEKREMGLVFQSYALWPHLTIRENVDFGLKLKKVEKTQRNKMTDKVMETLGIAKYAKRYPSELSGGQQQRVALARMLVVNPDVILLDEPLSNLDAKLRLDMRAELKRIHEAAKSTFIFVTHDQWEAMTLASTIAVMNEGHLLQVGAPSDIYDYPANRFVAEFLGATPINMVETTAGNTELAKSIAGFLAGAYPQMIKAHCAGIRPEAIVVSLMDTNTSMPKGAFQTEALLESVLPTGGSWILQLSTGGQRIFAITSETPRFNAGDKVSIVIQKESFHMFDEAGNRIRPDHEPKLDR